MAVRARLGTLLSNGLKVAMLPTDCGCRAIPGVRSVARTVVPGAREVGGEGCFQSVLRAPCEIPA
jgi:hypothetical protein